jgi:hypothetical protein
MNALDHDQSTDRTAMGDGSSIEPLLNERAAAKFLGVSPRTLWGLANCGEVPFVRVGKSAKRYDPRDLRAYCDKQRSRPPVIEGEPPAWGTGTAAENGGRSNG